MEKQYNSVKLSQGFHYIYAARLFVLIIYVGSSLEQCVNQYIALGSNMMQLNEQQTKYVRESFHQQKGKNYLNLSWNLPEECQKFNFRYRIKYRYLGKNLECCRVSSAPYEEKTAFSSQYNIQDLEPFSIYQVSILAEEIGGKGVRFYIIQNISSNTLSSDELTNSSLSIKRLDVHTKTFTIELGNLNCSEIFSKIKVLLKISCDDPQCTKYIFIQYETPLNNLTITFNVSLTPSLQYRCIGWIIKESGKTIPIGRKIFVLSDKPSKPNIKDLWNENNTMILNWVSVSSYSSDIIKFKIIVIEEEIWNGTFYYPISPGELSTSHNFSVPRMFNSNSLVSIFITAIDNNSNSETGNYTTSSYPVSPNWLNQNISYTSDNHTITVKLKILKSEKFCSSRFLFILMKTGKAGSEDEINVEKLEQKLRTKFYANHKTRIVGIINLSNGDPADLNYQIGNSTSPEVSSNVYDLGDIKYNNKDKLKKNHCYNITMLLVNELRRKYKFQKYSLNMCTSGNIVQMANKLSGEMAEWSKPMPIWLITLILLSSAAITIFLLYKISNAKNTKKNLQILVPDDFSTSNIFNTTTNVDGKSQSTISLATNDYEEIQENETGGISIEKYFKKVEAKSFENYVKKSLKTREMHTQHDMFAKGLVHPHEVGMSIENKMKNRYANLIAYDHSRVKLNIKVGCSDYINANYIKDINDQKTFIATQGPLPQTIADFWRMIWQERVKSIVMLANINEDGKKRVEKYWPDKNEKKIYGNICIRYRSVELFADYEYRIFSVTCDGEMRQVYQIHFTSWPGHGVPLYSHALVPIIRRMQELTPSMDSPVVVHCSAGVGRTGIILLSAISVQMAQEKGVIDMVYTLNKLREQRPNMVDNYEQYKLAHLVVLDCLNTMTTEIKCDDRFKHSVNRLLQNREDKLEFIYLKENQWRDEAMKSVAIDTKNCTNYPDKNRVQSLILGNQERIFLSELPNHDESSTYINAVWVHGYRSPKKFIVTQQPMPNTLSEFWRLIVEKDIRVVVSLNKIDLNNEGSCMFWPNEDEPKINPVDFLSVIFENVVHSTYFDIYSVKVFITNEKKKLHIKIYSLKNWESSIHLPPSCEGFLFFLDTVESISNESTHILVTCWDGLRASGIYVALSYTIERMKMEKVCDVCLSVRRVRHNREEFIVNDVQYSFLYSAALCWMKQQTGFQ